MNCSGPKEDVVKPGELFVRVGTNDKPKEKLLRTPSKTQKLLYPANGSILSLQSRMLHAGTNLQTAAKVIKMSTNHRLNI